MAPSFSGPHPAGTTHQAKCIDDHPRWLGKQMLSFVDAYNEALEHEKTQHSGENVATVLSLSPFGIRGFLHQ